MKTFKMSWIGLGLLALATQAMASVTLAPTLKLNVDHRLRLVSWNNAVTLNEDADAGNTFTRHRTRLGLVWTPQSNLTLGMTLTNEFRVYFKPDDRDFTLHEMIFDQLYLKWTRAAGLPVDWTLGRQNMIMGEGFVLMDGGPLDGSRSIYFNGARADFHLAEKHTLSALFLTQPVTEDYLPLLFQDQDGDQMMIEQPETGLGLYYSGQCRSMPVEAYFIRKSVDEKDARPESVINTLGGRVTLPLAKPLSLTTEAGLQFGEYGDEDRNAWGGHFHLDYKVKPSSVGLKTLTLGGIALSGDDPDTPEMEGWDPLFSRWPKWSESYIYTQIIEFGGRVAYWSNINSIFAGAKFEFHPKVKLNLNYHLLSASHANTSGFTTGGGKNRGSLFISRLIYQLNSHFSGHLLLETFSPGDYYPSTADGYYWFRFELFCKL